MLIQGAASAIALLIPVEAAARLLSAIIGIGGSFAFIFFYCTRVLHITLADCRVKKPRHIGLWLVIAAALPVSVSAFFLLFVPGSFAYKNPPTGAVVTILSQAVFGICLAAGMCEELVFRGYIMHILEIKWGKVTAILAPSVVFGLLHITAMQSPNLTDILMLLIAGTSVGLMFSLIAYRCNSIWPGALVHGLWNLVIIGHIVDIGAEHFGAAIFSYTLEPGSTLITGGAFGIEASLPAVIAYWCVIALTVFSEKGEVVSSEKGEVEELEKMVSDTSAPPF
ncbi:MAG: CPBP family intramembrane metalloprotease [Treponema sp.]|nr:CPBP family intramembrane metalloprotease [Treponema sp.]